MGRKTKEKDLELGVNHLTECVRSRARKRERARTRARAKIREIYQIISRYHITSPEYTDQAISAELRSPPPSPTPSSSYTFPP